MSNNKSRNFNAASESFGNDEPTDTFGSRTYDDEIFAALGDDQPDLPPGSVVAEPFPIKNIVPDIAQPRKIFPASIRAQWDGSASSLPALLMKWHSIVQDQYKTIPMKAILEGTYVVPEIKEGDEESIPAVALNFMKLVSLAASINRDGLINPITISDSGNVRKVSAGERRYLSYVLLNLFFQDEGWDSIPAFQKRHDVWTQASENGSRSGLNAIALARQLALLLMDIYRDEDGADFQPFHELVVGECDQPFYAQVANGRVFPARKEFAQKILDATGFESRQQISQYRRLLRIPAALWMQADEDDWSENAIREEVSESNTKPTGGKLTTVNISNDTDETLTTVNPDPADADTGPSPKQIKELRKTLERKYLDQYLIDPAGNRAQCTGITDDNMLLVSYHNGHTAEYYPTQVKLDNDQTTPLQAPLPPRTTGISRRQLVYGATVADKMNNRYTVIRFDANFDKVQVKAANGTRRNLDVGDIVAVMPPQNTQEATPPAASPARASGDAESATTDNTPPEGWMGQPVRTPAGYEGTVVGWDGSNLNVKTERGIQAYIPAFLELITDTDTTTADSGDTITDSGQTHQTKEDDSLLPQHDSYFDTEEDDNLFMTLAAWATFYELEDEVKAVEELAVMDFREACVLHEAGKLDNVLDAYANNITALLNMISRRTYERIQDLLMDVRGDEDGDA